MKYIIYIAGVITCFLQCSCSLSRSVSWGEYIAEIKPVTSEFAWGINQLEKINNDFVITTGVTDQYFSEENRNTFVENSHNITIKNSRIFDHFLNIDEESHSSIFEFRTSNGKVLWTKHFDSIVLFPDYIYDKNGNLSFLATASLDKNSTIDKVLLLDSQNGNIQATFTLDKISDFRVSGWICMSNDLRFLIIKQPIRLKSLGPFDFTYLIFKREQKKNSHFKYIGTLAFPKEWEEGLFYDHIRISNNVAIISMQSGRRTSFIPSQKIIFFNLENNSIMFEYYFKSCDWICDAAITADHKYAALFLTNHTIRLYKIKQ